MRKISLMAILIAGLMTVLWSVNGSWAQTIATGASDNEMMENQTINDEGYGNADAEYYGSQDDLVNDDSVSDENSQAQENTLSH